MTKKEFIMQRVREHYDEAVSLGHEVVGVWLQGSQNYDLDEYSDEYQSDIDTKCIVLPSSLGDIVKGSAPCSHTHVRENNEHIDIKDVRVMFEMFKKQNNAYIEILFTDYFIINPKYKKIVDIIWSKAEQIARLNTNQALRCMSGTSMEKYKALEHPYPNTMDKIEKFGYDPKQLHHILRINDFMLKYIEGKPYKNCLKPNNAKWLMDVKKGCLKLEEARILAKETDEKNKELKDLNIKEQDVVDKECVEFLDKMKFLLIEQHLREELK